VKYEESKILATDMEVSINIVEKPSKDRIRNEV
jgi:hypothetical protein